MTRTQGGPVHFLPAPVGAGLFLRMKPVEFPRREMVAAGGLVVADAAAGVNLLSVVVQIAGEAVRPAAMGAGVPGTPAAIFL